MFQAPLLDPRVGQKVSKSLDQDPTPTAGTATTKHCSSRCLDASQSIDLGVATKRQGDIVQSRDMLWWKDIHISALVPHLPVATEYICAYKRK